MKTNTLNASILAAGIALGAGGAVVSQAADADKVVKLKKENTRIKVANYTHREDGSWVLVVCGILHDNEGKALPETCHECPAVFPAVEDDFVSCHSMGEGLE